MTDTPRSNWDNAPEWFKWALHEIGVKEIPGPRSTDRIIAYRKIAGLPSKMDDSDLPWCAIFVNAALASCKVATSKSMGARSFERSSDFVKLLNPELGCIVTFWRGSKNSGLGHVGFYRGENATHVYVLGGNQGDSVSIAPVSKTKLVGYWWPSAQTIKHSGAVPIRAGQPLGETKVT